jgi:hypothetical protein
MKTQLKDAAKDRELFEKIITDVVNAMADTGVSRILLLKLTDICGKYIEQAQKLYN